VTIGPMISANNRRWWVLAAMTGALAMVLIDQTVVTVALPTMQRDLDLSPTGLQWTVNAYLLALAAIVAPAGRLGDALGRVRTFVIGVAVFAAASVGCGLADSEAAILAARAVQGIAAALMVTASAAIVIGAFPLRERGRAMAIYCTVPAALTAIGPLLGGWLTEHASWRLAFWINVPVALATLALVCIARPAAVRHPVRAFDAAGAGLLVTGVVSLVLGLQQSSAWGWGSPATAGAIAIGAALLALFVVVERRATDPIVDLRILGDRAFAADAAVLFLFQATLIVSMAYTAIYLQDILGFSPTRAGRALIWLILPALLVRGFVGRWFDAAGVRAPARAGTALAACGFFALVPAVAARSFEAMLPGLALQGLGLAFVLTPVSADALGRAPERLRGAAAGMTGAVRQIGASVGLAVVGAIIATSERARIADHVGPARAFSDSLALGYAVCGALMVGAFLVTLLVMRPGRQEEDAISTHHATTDAAPATS
jgi:EmrB/QacA subfamily drug resistance transporter